MAAKIKLGTELHCLHCGVHLKIKYLETEGNYYPLVLLCIICNEVMMQDAEDQPLRVPTPEEFAKVQSQVPPRLALLLKFGRPKANSQEPPLLH